MVGLPAPPPGAEEKLRDVRSITDAILSRRGGDEFLAELLARLKQILDADIAVVLLLDRSSRYLVAAAADGLEEDIAQGVRVPVGRGFAGRVVAEQRPVILDHVDSSNVFNPILIHRGLRSLAGVPLLVDSTVLGVLYVGSTHDRVFTADDAALLQLAAVRAALAIHSLRSRLDHVAAEALQRTLLPSALPAVSGVGIGTRYVPGRGQVGGDWYDTFRLPSGELALTVGDVAGSSLEAAVIMGRIRCILQAYAMEFPDPGDVLCKLDDRMQYFESDAMATVLYAVLDPSTGELRVSSAGHFPPVIAAPGRRATLADIAVEVPIGVADVPHRRVTTLRLVPGTVLCCFTDGLVERRGESLDVGIARLCDLVLPGPPESLCASIMEGLIGTDRAQDDIALLVLHWQLPDAGGPQ